MRLRSFIPEIPRYLEYKSRHRFRDAVVVGGIEQQHGDWLVFNGRAHSLLPEAVLKREGLSDPTRMVAALSYHPNWKIIVVSAPVIRINQV